MKRSEYLIQFFVIVAALGVIIVPLFLWARTPLVRARLPEAGGWNPEVIQAEVGVPLRLRLTSEDVVHGFAVGQMEMESVDVLPGKVSEVTLVFDKPGSYTFYCTRWCGPNHWRMRGTIEVSGSRSDLEPAPAPLYVSLGLNLDAPHKVPVWPTQKPSAMRGAQWAAHLDLSPYLDRDYYRSHSPFQVFGDLSSTPLSEAERWDIVAYLWQSQTTPEALANGARLYAQNCAACHGETGAGDGVFADDLATGGQTSMQNMAGAKERSIQAPSDFTDPRHMLGASPALLQGKILRGGMGTGMPMWGSIFTEQQTWDLVAFLYSFQFEYSR